MGFLNLVQEFELRGWRVFGMHLFPGEAYFRHFMIVPLRGTIDHVPRPERGTIDRVPRPERHHFQLPIGHSIVESTQIFSEKPSLYLQIYL